MNLDPLKTVLEAEHAAREVLVAAAREADQLVEDAESDGQRLIEEAQSNAKESVASLMAEAEKEALEAERLIALETQKTCQALRDQAQGKMSLAVSLIAERIVERL